MEQQENQKFANQVRRANTDLLARLRQLSVTSSYDPEEDLFVLTLGEAQEALTESVGNAWYVRLDPESYKVVGLEIPDVSQLIKSHPEVMDLWLHAARLTGPDSVNGGESIRRSLVNDLEKAVEMAGAA